MKEIQERILREKVIGIIRLKDDSKLMEVVAAIIAGGINLIEITLNTPNAFEHIVNIKEQYPGVCVGAGTVLGDENARNAIEAGAEFLVSPVCEVDVIEAASENDVVVITGSLTPNEIYEAHLHGVNFVKPFPMTGLGPAYIKALLAPMPFLRLIPTNGVTLDNMKEFFEAGVKAVGLGTPLVSENDAANGRFAEIEQRAKSAVDIVRSL
ncbi:MAG TPA: bifunctional 4-hydroxy-2-oxoglutarate aldolase/2-dehydro-3-deoxy-phosphogluconate aldolase [Candidatus Kapabacteria bacterium]